MSATRACRACRTAALALLAFLWAAGAVDAQPAREQPRYGGMLKVATVGEPPSLDPHGNASGVTSFPMWHVFETLFTFDGDFNPIPLLAEGHALAAIPQRPKPDLGRCSGLAEPLGGHGCRRPIALEVGERGRREGLP
jgi:hypothetical protein